MTRTSLDDAQWASMVLTMQQLPRAWKRDEAALRRFVEAALWIGRTGAPWRDLPGELGLWSSVYQCWRRWCVRSWWELVFEVMRPAVPLDGLVLLDSTTCKTHRAASGAACSTAAAEALGRSRGGICSKSGEPLGSRGSAASLATLHACADGAGRILRLIASPGQHSDLHYASALVSDIPARDAALDRGYVSARLRGDFGCNGCIVHTPPKPGEPLGSTLGMVDPPPWDKLIYARRHHIENLFSRLKDWGRIALWRDKTRQSWISFAHRAATLINLRVNQFSHRP